MNTQRAIVSGAARGIGLATAISLLNTGYTIAMLDRDQEALHDAVENMPGDKSNIRAVALDVSKADEIGTLIPNVVADLGGVDALVNNVGIFLPPGSRLENTKDDDWRRIIEVNVNGMFYLSKATGRHMIQNRNGSIVNVASIYGHRALDWRLNRGTSESASDDDLNRYDDASYHTSKAAILQLTRSMAVSWAPYRVRVNSVSPGPVQTTHPLDSLHIDRLSNRIPLGRIGQPGDIANAVKFLLSEDASYITGIDLPVDGGWLSL